MSTRLNIWLRFSVHLGARMNKLFLSYARGDDEVFVKGLYEDLTAEGFEVWWDRVSMPSRALTFLQEIRDAIHGADRMVVVIGPNAAFSRSPSL